MLSYCFTNEQHFYRKLLENCKKIDKVDKIFANYNQGNRKSVFRLPSSKAHNCIVIMEALSIPPFLQPFHVDTFSLENLEDDVNTWGSSDSDIAHSPISEPPSSPQEFNFPASLAIQILNAKPTDFLFSPLQPVHRTPQPPPQPSPPTERPKMERYSFVFIFYLLCKLS